MIVNSVDVVAQKHGDIVVYTIKLQQYVVGKTVCRDIKHTVTYNKICPKVLYLHNIKRYTKVL